MTEEVPSTRRSAHIASWVPGRLRLKLRKKPHDTHAMDHIKASLESREGVHGVRVNSLNGSLTVRYDNNRHGAAGILGLLEDLDVVVESIGHLPSVNGTPSDSSLLAAIEDLNGRIRTTTGLPVDIKLILPLAFIAAGIWSTMRKGLMIEAVPGWLFLWFAFDIFVKLHPNPRSAEPDPER